MKLQPINLVNPTIIEQVEAIIKQRIDKKLLESEISEIVVNTLLKWGDKAINKRLATKIQEEIDNKFGVITLDKPNWLGETFYSKILVIYNKSESWGGEPRYRLEIYSHYMLPEIMLTTGENYNRTHNQDTHKIEFGSSYFEDVEAMIKTFKTCQESKEYIESYKKLLADFKSGLIESEFNTYKEAAKKWDNCKNNYKNCNGQYLISSILEK